jgi:Flp pilus assembly protein TadD
MYAAGVTCSDCHDPHSLAPRAAGNALCTRCHLAERFDTESHHHHTAGSEGAQCVNCHMPPRTYMVVDVRRDHSLRLPRPDLTRSVGVPNACASCHGNRPASWAAAAIASWRPGWVPPAHFATAFDSARRELPRSDFALAGMVSDVSQPAIARATALAMLTTFPGPAALRAAGAGLRDPDAMVRAQAAALTEMLPPDQRMPRAAPLLRDPVRLVRIEAARVLAEAHAGIPAADTAAFRAALAELLASERLHLERPESHVNLATLEMALGRTTPAERQLAEALALDSLNVPAMVNLADLKRLEARDDDGELWLRRAMRVEPGAAEPVFALALLKVRAGQQAEALELLRRATAMAPGDARYAYTYGVALNSSGDARQALQVLRVAQHRHPSDREILNALITMERDRGHVQASAVWARKLELLNRR